MPPTDDLVTPSPLPYIGYAYSHFQLTNGLKVFIVQNHASPILSFQTWFGVGSKHERLDPQIEATGLAHLFEHMMFRGTKLYPDGSFDSILFKAGATDQNATTWLDRTNYYQSVPSDQLELVIKLEADRLENLQVAQHFETERGAVLGELNMVLDDPVSVAYEKIYAAAFDVHPYRFSTIGTEAEIKSFTAEQALQFYRKYYSPSNAVILMVGDVDPKSARDLIRTYYGKLARISIDWPKAPIDPPQMAEKKTEFRHPQLAQEKLIASYHTPGVESVDFASLAILRSILSLGDGGVLQKIWIDSGLASGLQGDLDQFKDPGLMTFMADIQPGHSESELLVALDSTIEQLKNGRLALDIERARNLLRLQIYSDWDDNAGLASFMGEYLMTTGDPRFGFLLCEALGRVTEADVLSAIDKYLRRENRTTLVGRPA
jgi:zinc protease